MRLILPFVFAASVDAALQSTNAASYQQHVNGFWENLFLDEGVDANYPLPHSTQVVDLLDAFEGIGGTAVHSKPDVTVTEGQGYAMFAAGMRGDVPTLKKLTVGWQALGQAFGGQPPCGGCTGIDGPSSPQEICAEATATSSGTICKLVDGAYMPAWQAPINTVGSMGSATDGDQDAVTGLIYLAELTGNVEIRSFAIKSITAFVLEDLGFGVPALNSRPVPHVGDIPSELQVMWLWRGGTGWGGYDTSSGSDMRDLCINPAYFSPGQWRLFSEYLLLYPEYVPAPYNADDLRKVLRSAITWGYNTLNRISCSNGLVSNWWTVSDTDFPWKGRLHCLNSGTAAGQYYSDASRLPWRVVLDHIWYPEAAAQTPLFNDRGIKIGTWGPRDYANRWATTWINAVKDSYPSGSYPPLNSSVVPLRNDQILPLLKSSFQSCSSVPLGNGYSPWNGWGSYPIVTTLAVPISGMDETLQQEWLDFIDDRVALGVTTEGYFDLSQEVICSAMLSGMAWNPAEGTSPPTLKPVKGTNSPTLKPTPSLEPTQKGQTHTPTARRPGPGWSGSPMPSLTSANDRGGTEPSASSASPSDAPTEPEVLPFVNAPDSARISSSFIALGIIVPIVFIIAVILFRHYKRTFDKHKGSICRFAQLIITDSSVYLFNEDSWKRMFANRATKVDDVTLTEQPNPLSTAAAGNGEEQQEPELGLEHIRQEDAEEGVSGSLPLPRESAGTSASDRSDGGAHSEDSVEEEERPSRAYDMRIERERREELIERAFVSMSGLNLTLGNQLSDISDHARDKRSDSGSSSENYNNSKGLASLTSNSTETLENEVIELPGKLGLMNRRDRADSTATVEEEEDLPYDSTCIDSISPVQDADSEDDLYDDKAVAFPLQDLPSPASLRLDSTLSPRVSSKLSLPQSEGTPNNGVEDNADEAATRLGHGGPLSPVLQEERREFSKAAENCASPERNISRPELPQSKGKSSFNYPRAGSSSSTAREIGGPALV